jgi:hypothetical protein
VNFHGRASAMIRWIWPVREIAWSHR